MFLIKGIATTVVGAGALIGVGAGMVQGINSIIEKTSNLVIKVEDKAKTESEDKIKVLDAELVVLKHQHNAKEKEYAKLEGTLKHQETLSEEVKKLKAELDTNKSKIKDLEAELKEYKKNLCTYNKIASIANNRWRRNYGWLVSREEWEKARRECGI